MRHLRLLVCHPCHGHGVCQHRHLQTMHCVVCDTGEPVWSVFCVCAASPRLAHYLSKVEQRFTYRTVALVSLLSKPRLALQSMRQWCRELWLTLWHEHTCLIIAEHRALILSRVYLLWSSAHTRALCEPVRKLAQQRSGSKAVLVGLQSFGALGMQPKHHHCTVLLPCARWPGKFWVGVCIESPSSKLALPWYVPSRRCVNPPPRETKKPDVFNDKLHTSVLRRLGYVFFLRFFFFFCSRKAPHDLRTLA